MSRKQVRADYVTYKKYQNRAVTEIRKDKKSFEKKLSESQSDGYWESSSKLD